VSPLSDVHVRGSGIVGPVKGLRIHRRRALELLPQRLHRYLAEQIDLDDWYPMEDHLELLRALIEVVPLAGPRQVEDPWRWMGVLTADFDLVEVYSTTVQRGDPRGTLLKLPENWRLYHDAGELTTAATGEHEGRLDVRDFRFTTDEYCRLLTGYFTEALRLAGARDAAVRCQSRGEDRACWEAGW